MPRVSPAHEEAIRQRIALAALKVFTDTGYHRASMQDVVRASGLSVGAIYTYYKGKAELFQAVCDLATDAELSAMKDRVAQASTLRDKISIAVGFFFDGLTNNPEQMTWVVQAWAEAGQDRVVREVLLRRREQIRAITDLLLREGIARGEFPHWLELGAVVDGFTALLDGLVLQRIEEGASYRRGDAERRVLAFVDLLFAANAASERPAIPPAPPRPWPFAPAPTPRPVAKARKSRARGTKPVGTPSP